MIGMLLYTVWNTIYYRTLHEIAGIYNHQNLFYGAFLWLAFCPCTNIVIELLFLVFWSSIKDLIFQATKMICLVMIDDTFLYGYITFLAYNEQQPKPKNRCKIHTCITVNFNYLTLEIHSLFDNSTQFELYKNYPPEEIFKYYPYCVQVL